QQRAFDLGIEDAVAIVQCGIERVDGTLRLTPGPVEIGKQEPPHPGPVAFSSASFCRQKLQPDVVAGLPSQSLDAKEGITDFYDDELHFLETGRVRFTPVFDHGTQEIDLVFEFATD